MGSRPSAPNPAGFLPKEGSTRTFSRDAMLNASMGVGRRLTRAECNIII